MAAMASVLHNKTNRGNIVANFSSTLDASVSSGAAQPHRGALGIITMLFFMWGLLTSLNDVLIPHLKAVYTLSYVQAMLVQFCFFGAYFLVSLPAGLLIRWIGYQYGVVAGLMLAAAGCALFYPASLGGYGLFLTAFFVLASGITILQVAANPYVTGLGDAATASSRLTLTQAFNALGTTVAPALGGMLILSGTGLPEVPGANQKALEAATVQGPYMVLAVLLLLTAIAFAWVRLPRLAQAAERGHGAAGLLSQRRLVLGVVAIFLYVGGEVSIGSLLINFMGEPGVAGLDAAAAAPFVSYYWGGAMVGRFIGFAVMRKVSPGKALGFNAACSVLLILCAVLSQGKLAMWAILAVGMFNSIMFPTIFSMALHKLGPATGQGSGLLCMAIVGGAIVPFAQGWLADRVGVQHSFVLPVFCYLYVMFFGIRYANLYADRDTKA
jgi:FHS family L-fucose permease-like MFS transporter